MNTDAEIAFNEIRSQIEQLNGEDLLKHLLIRLNDSKATDIEQLRRYQIWNLLLLVKWTVMYGDFTVLRQFEPVEETKLHQLLDLTNILSDQISAFGNASELHLYLRKLAYQQFWLQKKESIPFGIARQYLLFGNLPATHSFQSQFEGITGVSISDFIDIAVAVFHYLLIDESRILLMKEWFFAEAQVHGGDTIEKFLDSISTTTDDARRWLTKLEEDKNETVRTLANEYIEHSPFARYPLFKHEDKYFVISPTLLLHSLSTFVHDVLRAANPSSFMDTFGKMFENLLERSLRAETTDFLNEKELLRHFGHVSNRKVVDFIVTDNGCNIFIEAKGIVMRWEAMTADSQQTLQNDRRIRSLLKAIRQAYDVASRIKPGEIICGKEFGQGENYLLVVTMKEFMLGSGRSFYNNTAKDKIDRIKADYDDKEQIPLDNIFFVSVDELDIILGQVAQGSWSFSQLMAAAVEAGHTFGVQSVFRELVTQSNARIHPPPLIEQATSDLFSQAAAILKKSD